MSCAGATNDPLAAILADERGRLVGLCARLAGDRAIAEDLAQETLVEAWRNRHKLTDPAGAAPWLSAIARNVCLRWRSRHGRGPSDITALPDHPAEPRAVYRDGGLPASFDLEVDLERHELAALLDRALALLPPETRAALVARYIEELPPAVIAARLGVGEGAVKARLQRGKLALRRVLSTDLREEAVAYGLVALADGA